MISKKKVKLMVKNKKNDKILIEIMVLMLTEYKEA